MLSYSLKRLVTVFATLLAVSILIFAIVQLPAGNYITNQIAELEAQGESASAERAQFLLREFDLDKSLAEQYAIWIGVWPGSRGFSGLIQGDWGWSFEFDRPVSDVVGDTLVLTFVVNLATVIFIYAVAFPIGIYSATRPYSWGDYGFTFLGYLGLATPNFLLGLILLYYANVWFGVSIGGLMHPQYVGAAWSWDKAMSVLAHLFIPVLVIGTSGTAAMIRRLRANLLDELQKPYVTTARAKGLSERRAILKYPLRMALNPFIADIGNLLPTLVSGSVIVSVVLNLPTIGPVLLNSLQAQDHFLAAFILLFLSALTIIGMLISDLLLALLDPRIRFEGRNW